MHRHFSDPDATKALFEKYKPTHVIHLAAVGMLLAISTKKNSVLIHGSVFLQSAACS